MINLLPKRTKLSSLSGDTVTAGTHQDFSAVSQFISYLKKRKLPERNDLGFPGIQDDTFLGKLDLQLFQTPFQVFTALMNVNAVIHISFTEIQSENFNSVMVDIAWISNCQNLADLTAYTETFLAECINKLMGQTDNPLITKGFLQKFPDRFMLNIVEISGKVNLQNPALIITMFPIIPLQMLLYPEHRKVDSFVLQAGSVIVDQTSAQSRHKRVITEASLNNAFFEVHASDMPDLAPFPKSKANKALGNLQSTFQPSSGFNQISEESLKISLNAGFPGNTFLAFFRCLE